MEEYSGLPTECVQQPIIEQQILEQAEEFLFYKKQSNT